MLKEKFSNGLYEEGIKVTRVSRDTIISKMPVDRSRNTTHLKLLATAHSVTDENISRTAVIFRIGGYRPIKPSKELITESHCKRVTDAIINTDIRHK